MAIITPQNAADLARRSHEPNCRISPKRTIKSLGDLQDRLEAIALTKDTPPREVAQCALAWERLESRKAVLSGLPANTSQSIRADAPKKGRRQSQQASAPIESEQEEPRTRASAPVHPTEQLPDNVTDARGTAKTE